MSNFILKKDQLCSFYDDIAEGDFRVGYFVFCDQTYAIFNLLTTRGYEDGLYLTRLDNIYRVDCDDRYTQRIERLSEINGSGRVDVNFSEKEDAITAVLAFSKNNGFLVTVEVEDGELVTGSIDTVDDEWITFNVISDDGILDGKSAVLIDSIVRLHCNSGRERNIQALM